MGIIAWTIVGLIVGALAKLVMPGRDPGGIVVTILIGIAGALLGAEIGRELDVEGPLDQAGWIASILGAVLLLAIYRVALGRQA